MKFEITKNEMFTIERKIVNIRTKLQNLESELVYMPIKNMDTFMARVAVYQYKVTQMRFMCSEALAILHGTKNSKGLIFPTNQ